MKSNNNHSISSLTKPYKTPSKIRSLIFILEICFIAFLFVIWFSSESIRNSKYLWVFFFYSFPSNFLISIVPHEPVILYFSKFYYPLTVVFVAVAGVLPTEAINYSVFKYVADLRLFKRARQSKIVIKVVELFNKAPFIALLIAALTPIPFYPFRFLVVLAHYPLWKYILAIFLGRAPRYFVIALVGYAFKIPDYLLIALFIALLLTTNFPIVLNLLKRRRAKKENAT